MISQHFAALGAALPLAGFVSYIWFDQGRRTALKPITRIWCAIEASGAKSRPATTKSCSSAPYQLTAASFTRRPVLSTRNRPLVCSGPVCAAAV